MVLIVISAIVILTAVIYGWIKAVNAIFNPLIRKLDAKKKRISGEDNTYITSHRIKMANDEMYDQYLEWLDKNGGDLPFEKWKTQEEKQFESKLNNTL